MTQVAIEELRSADDQTRRLRVSILMGRMETLGVSSLISALDFFEAGVLTREEAELASGAEAQIFSRELLIRRRERKQNIKALRSR